ncbi:RNA polymerase II-associated protein [Coprinopsis marcescibilis]|uniref:RNA polymerase II-associated protein n=1 Tax=Coprinopsis marcescibilis TaxID=230819 RepID=A0A5C3KY45_COPMA|nr:RNA polymerase II-associated protein [Coprinopsis marcescibilis]
MDEVQTGRSVDIELGGQEVITIDLDNLDPNPVDVLDLLKEGQCKIWIWTKLAAEYWRRGYLDAAEKIAQAAIESFHATGSSNSLPPIYALLANVQLSHARKAPTLILEDAQHDIVENETPKKHLYGEASKFSNIAQKMVEHSGEVMDGTLPFLTRGIQQLAQKNWDDALRSFEGVLTGSPTNIVALLGKARVLYAQRRHKDALRVYQDVLRYKPDCKPDPRIGIGLCLWALDFKAKAKAAWQRSLEVNPGEWAAQLLLGLESINASKAEGISEEAKSQAFIAGTKMVEKAFQANQKNASSANALCELFIRKGNYPRAMKLAERTIQFADTRSMLIEGYLRAGRVAHAQGNVAQARQFYSNIMEMLSQGEKATKHVVASIGMAQLQMHYDETPAAIHTLDTLLQQPNAQRSVEATVMLASLRACPREGVIAYDLAQEQARARDLFDRALKGIEIDGARSGPSKASRNITEDLEMHLEIARLWQGENIERVGKAYEEAMRISEASGDIDPRLINNISALKHLDGRFSEARALYETALMKTATLQSTDTESMSTSMLYNLARVYEDEGETTLAKSAYDKLLSRHPEYIDAKIRLAHMLLQLNRITEAHDLLKQALTSQPTNHNLRAFYSYFLMETIRVNDHRPLKDFVHATAQMEKHDVYALCLVGWVHYFQAREHRDVTQKGIDERKKLFMRGIEFYEKALSVDPSCAYAAQGLAIVLADDALGTLHGAMGAPTADENQRRISTIREALDIFTKVRESINDGSVYVNMGHCYYARDEFDRAIESYETASIRFYNGKNVPVLVCLCRSWYSKAIKDQSLAAMNTALRYAQSALHIQPADKVALYNIAMIQQKAAEMMFSIPSQKRTLKDLQRVIDQAANANKLFASLAGDKSPVLPYNRDIAVQRRKYGDSMLRKADEHLSTQRQYETEQQTRLETARQKRSEEKAKQEAEERRRMEELRQEAEKLAEERRIAREQAMEWTREAKIESDEEKERRQKKTKRAKVEPTSGDDAAPEPKKKRRGKLKRASSEQVEEEQAAFSDEEDVEKPAKKRSAKKRVVRDEDDEEPSGPARKKQFKSKEVLSDTDEEMP